MAFSGNQVTRLGLYGGARFPYGSFAGKEEASGVATRAPFASFAYLEPLAVATTLEPHVQSTHLEPRVDEASI